MLRASQVRQALALVEQWQARTAAAGPLWHVLAHGPASASARAHQTAAGTDRQPSKTSSIDAKEAAKFAALANEWWQPRGPFLPLHRMNAARCKFIRDAVCAMQGLDPQSKEPFQGLTALDVGCGGGILSESIARLGAHTHGIDITEPNVMAATAHAVSDPLISSRVRYQCVSLEALIGVDRGSASDQNGDDTHEPEDSPSASSSGRQEDGPQYDVVMASEVLEHVRRPHVFMRHLAKAVQPGGTLVVSTINRTPASYAVAIVGAEYVSGLVPRGTHDWSKFITPQELYLMASEAGLSLAHAAGMVFSPSTGRFDCSSDLSVNYIAAFHRPAHVGAAPVQ